MIRTEPAEGRLSRPYDEVMGTGGIQELSARVRKQYGIQPELTGAKVRASLCFSVFLNCWMDTENAPLLTVLMLQ